RSIAMKKLRLLALLLTGATFSASYITAAHAAEDVIISEFLTSNVNGIRDENNERVDWIEIYNRGTGTVNLLNWKLKDSSDEWAFPAPNIAPGRFILIFA